MVASTSFASRSWAASLLKASGRAAVSVITYTTRASGSSAFTPAAAGARWLCRGATITGRPSNPSQDSTACRWGLFCSSTDRQRNWSGV